MTDGLGQTQEESGAQSMADMAGMYLTFTLSEEVYGLEILKVQEIIGMMNVTKMPRTPHFIRGVINLRGKVIPVMDLRLKFGMEAQDDTDLTCIIVVKVQSADDIITIGLIVDAVSEVVDIAGEQIEPPPSFGTSVDTTFLLGMGKIGEKVVMLLDVSRVLTSGELELVGQVAASES